MMNDAARKPYRVLIVDDDRDLVRALIVRVSTSGFDASAVHDGRAAISTARATLPDAIVLDLRMPGMSGFDVLGELRGDETTARIPVLVLSANIAERARAMALDLGATSYMLKPFHANTLIASLTAIIDAGAQK